MKKKLITLLLAMSMVTTTFAGCGKEEEKVEASKQSDAASSSATQVQEEVSNFNAEGYPIVNEPITLDVLIQIQDSQSLADPKDMPALQRLEELTGIKAEYELVKKADWDTKLNLRLATNDYPDVIMSIRGTVDQEEYGVSQNVLLPLEDLVDQYMPTYKELVASQESDSTSAQLASDGHRYTLAFKWGGEYKADSVFFINQKWLDALKLEAPTDVESLTEVLRAFRDGDPNGNGEKDEIPMGGTLQDRTLRYMLSLFGIPCSNNSWLYIDEDKQVQSITSQEGFRECMEWLNMCYEEGILDQEAISQDSNTVVAKLSEAKVGFFTEYRLTAMGFDAIAEDAVLWVPNAEETRMRKLFNQAASCVYVSTTNENIPATMRWLDAWLDKETMASNYLGEKDAADGGWFYNADGLIEQNPNNSVASAGATMTYLGNNCFVFAPWNYYKENFAVGSHITEKSSYDDIYTEAGLFQTYSNDLMSIAKFDNQTDERRKLIKADLDTAITEWIATFVSEGVTDSSWNEFTKVIEDIGMEEFIEIYQTGLDNLQLAE